MAVKYFEDFQIRQEARRLASKVYDATRKPSFSRDYGLSDQIRRACVPVINSLEIVLSCPTRSGIQKTPWIPASPGMTV